MNGEQAEEILNNSDLRKRSYTENLALINYQMAEIRTDVKEYSQHQKEMNERLWGAIGENKDAIGQSEKDIIVLRERQRWWNVGLGILGAIASGLGLKN